LWAVSQRLENLYTTPFSPPFAMQRERQHDEDAARASTRADVSVTSVEFAGGSVMYQVHSGWRTQRAAAFSRWSVPFWRADMYGGATYRCRVRLRARHQRTESFSSEVRYFANCVNDCASRAKAADIMIVQSLDTEIAGKPRAPSWKRSIA